MALTFVKHEKLFLKSYPGFQEAWLQDQISKDTSILGLGELDVIERERTQPSGGRLDMLLADVEKNARYEVEIMFGATDPSHIIRCIEYWEHERRHFPAYNHVAVIVAEEITTRFLNVLALFSGSIPLVAIQLNALRVGDNILLDFVKVLDQRALREDDVVERGGDVDRTWWENKKGLDKVKICEKLLEFAREKENTNYELRYKKSHISICPSGSFFNVAVFWPKINFVRSRFKIAEVETWLKRFEEAGIDAESPKDGRIQVRITSQDLSQNGNLFRELMLNCGEDSEA